MAHSDSVSDFVRWFRASSPYIHAHRGKTFVVYFGGEALEDERFPHLIHDLALLNGLGVRLVLVHGIRPQIDRRLREAGLESLYHMGQRITDRVALEMVKEAGGTVRVEIEALMSMGVANTPMAGVRIQVVSGNFVIARPIGIRDGIDFQHTGEVRRIDTEGIVRILDQGDIVMLSAIGYSPTGEIFNLRSVEVATRTAVALKADKFLLLGEGECRDQSTGRLLRQLTTREVDDLLAEDGRVLDHDMKPFLQAASLAAEGGVERSHLINRHLDGGILQELFTRDGGGTLVSRTPFENLRKAKVGDVPGMLDLILPLEQKGVLVPRSKERLESEIDDYTVIERDGTIIGCAALHGFPEAGMGEIACLVLHSDYHRGKRGERLLKHLEDKARRLGFISLFALSTQTVDWFRERGYELAALSDLPLVRQAVYNFSRNSRVLMKRLDSGD